MDLSLATIPHLEGGFVTLYREPIVRYQVENPKGPMDQILCLDDIMGNLFAVDPTFRIEPCRDPNGTWTLEFDGAHSSFGSGVGIVLTTPSKETFYFSYRLEYNFTNDIVEYEYFLI